MATLKIYGANGSLGGIRAKLKQSVGTNTSCYGIFSNGEAVFLDAGSGLVEASIDLLELKPKQITIALSHYHHDHINGFLLSSMCYHTPYETKIKVYGPPFIKEAIQNRFSSLISPCPNTALTNIEEFIEVEENQEILTRNILLKTFIGGFHPAIISPELKNDPRSAFYNHNGVLGWTVEVEGSKIAYATDMEFDYKLINGKIITMTSEEKRKREQRYLEAIQNSSILIADGQYTYEDYIERKMYIGFGHTYPERIIELAREAKVKTIIITHHMPTRSDLEINLLEEDLKRKYPEENISFARENDTWNLERII